MPRLHNQDISWHIHIRSGRAFEGGEVVASAAGEYSLAQIYNPVGSGVKVIVKKCVASFNTSGILFTTTYNTDLGTGDAAGYNLNYQGSSPVALLRETTSASLLDPLEIFSLNHILYATEFFDDWGPELAEGNGLVLHSLTTNIQLYYTFRWIELPL